jgi:hypothetical protein
MRLLLASTLLAAVASFGCVAYVFVPMPGRGKPEAAAVPVVAADASPVRVIPLGSGAGAVASAPRAPSVAEPDRVVAAAPSPAVQPPSPQAVPVALARAVDPAPSAGAAAPPDGGDVLASVGRTLDGLKASEAGTPSPAGLTADQVEALRGVAAKRRVRPVTRLSFPLEAGASVPAQVYLHPVPGEVSTLAQDGDGLGFAVVGDRFVVVGTGSRRIVAVSASR